MTMLHLPQHDFGWFALGLGAWLIAGGLIGALHFLTLWVNVRMLANGNSLFLALALQLARFVVTAAALTAVAILYGALPLLVATAGILAMRTAVIRLAGAA